jgi:nucleoside-diphosphate-sugar epimerase
MKTCLVTGGAGFIGSHLCEQLLGCGHAVRVLDNFSTGKPENLAAVRDRIEVHEGDIRDVAACRKACEGVDYVFHLAALASVPLSVENPFLTNEINVTGTLNILWAARDAGAKRLVFASSTSVYGDNPELPKREEMSGTPLSPYALSKLLGEKTCQSFSKVYGLSTVCLRYFNVYGPRQDPKSQYAAAVPIFISRMVAGERPTIYGDGEQTRDFVFVLDIAQANILAAETPDVTGEIFNIASEGSLTINALARTINEVLGSSLEPAYEPPRQGDILHSAADIERARERLAFRPLYDFRRGLEMTVAWFKAKEKPA